LIAEARSELERRVAGATLSPPVLGAWHTLTTRPSAFWDATWQEA
jgi:hypothetical protein